MWRDLLEKVKAAGFNTVAFYANWAYHAPTPNSTDFASGAHDIEPLFTMAKELGLYVIFRPGPYINAGAQSAAGVDTTHTRRQRRTRAASPAG